MYPGAGITMAKESRVATEEEIAKMRAEDQLREALYRERERLGSMFRLIQESGNTEDVLRAKKILQPLAVEILSR